MAQLDDDVGLVMQHLKDMGEDDNTIVVFTTDNGTELFTWPDGGTTPFAQCKGDGPRGRLPRALHPALARPRPGGLRSERHLLRPGLVPDLPRRRRQPAEAPAANRNDLHGGRLARAVRPPSRPMRIGFQHPDHGGMAENSLAFQRRHGSERESSPAGTTEMDRVSRPCGTYPTQTTNSSLLSSNSCSWVKFTARTLRPRTGRDQRRTSAHRPEFFSPPMNLPPGMVRTRSTASHSFRAKSGTRWNASLPGSGMGNSVAPPPAAIAPPRFP